MADSHAMRIPESAPTQVMTQDCSIDVATIVRQIRLCRSTLGSILDELESGDADAVIKIAECTTAVTAEIESLWETVRKAT